MEHKQATLDIISLLMAHGSNCDELYTPVSNSSSPHLCTMHFLRDPQWFLDLVPGAENHFLRQGDAHSPHQFKYKPRRLLHQAAIWNNAAMADLLLSHKADQNARDFKVSHGFGWVTCCHAMSSVLCTRSHCSVSFWLASSSLTHYHVAVVAWLQ